MVTPTVQTSIIKSVGSHMLLVNILYTYVKSAVFLTQGNRNSLALKASHKHVHCHCYISIICEKKRKTAEHFLMSKPKDMRYLSACRNLKTINTVFTSFAVLINLQVIVLWFCNDAVVF